MRISAGMGLGVAGLLAAGCAPGGAPGSAGEEAAADTAAAPAAEAQVGGTLTYVHNVPIKYIDSAQQRDYPSSVEALFCIFDTPIMNDPDLNLMPGLATSWEASEDGRTVTFVLRDDVVFTDGTPFNAEAVKYHHDRHMEVGTSKILWAPISSVEVVDEYTVAFHSDEPYAPLLRYLAHQSAGIESPTAAEERGEEFGIHPVSCGPYKVESFDPGVELVLTRNEDYWGETPKLDSIVWRSALEAGTRLAMLETGEADVINDVPPEEVERLQSHPDMDVIVQRGLRVMYLQMDHLKEPFTDVRVRKALCHAIDRQAIVDSLFRGYATICDSPVAPAIPGHITTETQYPYDPEKAQELLFEAGYELQDGVMVKDGEPLSFTINVSEGEFPKDLQVIEASQQYFKEIGVQAEIQKVEASGRWDLLRVPPNQAEYEMAYFGFNPSNGDIGYHLKSKHYSNPGPDQPLLSWNLDHYSNEEVDRLIDESEVQLDQEQRFETLAQVQELVMQDAPCIFMFVPDLLVGKRTNVEGVIVWPTIFTILRDAYKV